jgi:hypothetical protein
MVRPDGVRGLTRAASAARRGGSSAAGAVTGRATNLIWKMQAALLCPSLERQNDLNAEASLVMAGGGSG